MLMSNSPQIKKSFFFLRDLHTLFCIYEETQQQLQNKINILNMFNSSLYIYMKYIYKSMNICNARKYLHTSNNTKLSFIFNFIR